MKIAMLLLLWRAVSASSPQNGSEVSGVAFPFAVPTSSVCFCWERERNERLVWGWERSLI